MKQKGKAKKKITCPYCGAPAILRDASYVYGERSLTDKLYVCAHYPKCDAYVGVFKNSDIPKGTLADSELRNKRIQAHRYFDAIWKQGIMTRSHTYQWMQYKFGLTKEQAHIGYFSDFMCLQLIAACKEVLKNNRKLVDDVVRKGA